MVEFLEILHRNYCCMEFTTGERIYWQIVEENRISDRLFFINLYSDNAKYTHAPGRGRKGLHIRKKRLFKLTKIWSHQGSNPILQKLYIWVTVHYIRASATFLGNFVLWTIISGSKRKKKAKNVTGMIFSVTGTFI